MPLPTLEEAEQEFQSLQQPQSQPTNGAANGAAPGRLPSLEDAEREYGLLQDQQKRQQDISQKAQQFNAEHAARPWYTKPMSTAIALTPAGLIAGAASGTTGNSEFNPLVRGMKGAAGSIGQALTAGSNFGTAGALHGVEDASKEFANQPKIEEEAYRQKYGKPTPFAERLVSGTTQSLSEIFGVGGTAGGPAYLAMGGANAYDSGLREAHEKGVTGAKAHTYAGINAAAEVLSEGIFYVLGKGAPAKLLGLRKAVKGLLADTLLTAGEEATEEVANQLAQNINKRAHGITNEDGSPVNLSDGLVEAGAIGGLTGGIAGGASHQPQPAQPGQQRGQQPQPQQPPQAPLNGQAPAPTANAPPIMPAAAPGTPAQGPQTSIPQPGPVQGAEHPAPVAVEVTTIAPEHGAEPKVEEAAKIAETVAPVLESLPGVTNELKKTFGKKEPKLTSTERKALRDLGLNNAQIAKLGPAKAREALKTPTTPVEQPATPTERPPAVIPVTEHQPGAGGAPKSYTVFHASPSPIVGKFKPGPGNLPGEPAGVWFSHDPKDAEIIASGSQGSWTNPKASKWSVFPKKEISAHSREYADLQARSTAEAGTNSGPAFSDAFAKNLRAAGYDAVITPHFGDVKHGFHLISLIQKT